MSIFKYFYEPRNMFLNVLKWCPLDGKTYRRKTLPSFALVWTRPHFKLYWFPKDSFAAHPNDINNKRVAGHWGPTVLWHKTTTDWYFTPPPKTSHKPKQASPLPSLPTVHRPTLPPHNPPPLWNPLHDYCALLFRHPHITQNKWVPYFPLSPPPPPPPFSYFLSLSFSPSLGCRWKAGIEPAVAFQNLRPRLQCVWLFNTAGSH